MSTHQSLERIVTLPTDDDPQAWRREVRTLLRECVHPDHVVWRVGGESDLFADLGEPPPQAEPAKVSLPKSAVKLVETAIHHADRDRFALLYRFLWRSQNVRDLAFNMADPDNVAVRRLEKAIRRDAHKMHAFVRFRKVDEVDGRERYAAWFEPDHHIIEREAPFFMRRFANMDWAIVTPRKTAIYENGKVRFAPGGQREDVPADDAFEDAWCAYYAHIFNPARIMTDAMRAEMPKKYWKNLPEARLIPQLLEQAPARVAKMNAAAQSAPERLQLETQHGTTAWNDVDEIRRAVHQCTACDLHCHATQAVTGEGPLDAHLFLIGEQPGDHEDLGGRPFIGPAGQLLDQHLAQVGIDRSACYVTNAVKHFKFQFRGKRRVHQAPKITEIDACAPFLHGEHHLVRPKVTVSLGATALRGLLGKTMPLSRVRGETLQLPAAMGGGGLVPTFHPSYLLRLKDEGQRAVEARKFTADLAKAAELAKGEA